MAEVCGEEVGYEKFGDVYGATCGRPKGHRGSHERFPVEGDRINGKTAKAIRQEALQEALRAVVNTPVVGKFDDEYVWNAAVTQCEAAIQALIDQE